MLRCRLKLTVRKNTAPCYLFDVTTCSTKDQNFPNTCQILDDRPRNPCPVWTCDTSLEDAFPSQFRRSSSLLFEVDQPKIFEVDQPKMFEVDQPKMFEVDQRKVFEASLSLSTTPKLTPTTAIAFPIDNSVR